MPDGQCLAMMPASWPAPEESRKGSWPQAAMASLDGLDDAGIERDGRVLLEGIDVDADVAPLGDLGAASASSAVWARWRDGVGRARACRW